MFTMEDGKRVTSKNRLAILLAASLFIAMSLTATSVSLAFPTSHREPAVMAAPGSNAGGAHNIRPISAPVGSCPAPSFSPPTNYPVGEAPSAVTSADFNNDGNLDLAVVNNTPGTVSMLLGNGMGGFASAGDFAVGNAPSDVTAADFNHDGNADLAVARAGSSPDNVSVVLGNGTGGFGPPTLMVAGTLPARVRVGDFNEDGHPDMVFSNVNSNNVSLFLGNGMGGFSPPTNFPAGARPLGIRVGDFNEDGNLDIVVSNNVNPSTVSVLLGNGMGGFGPPTSYPSGQDTGPLDIGDFNEDGNLDVALSSGSAIAVLLGNGSGGFGAPTEHPTGGVSSSIVVRDFTQDGHLDIASANVIPPEVAVTVQAGNGAGGFAPPVIFPAGFLSSSIEAGDFNEDGGLDLAVSNSGDDNLSVLLNNCQAATTTTPTAISTVTLTSTPVANTATQTATPTGTVAVTSTATTSATQTITPTATSSTPAPVTSTPTRTVAPPTATACTVSFTDVPPSNTFYANIRCLACRGILGGYSDGTFRPNNDITRGQIAKVVSNAAGFNESPGAQIYEDVPASNTFYSWINRLSMRGHMGGYPCGTVPTEPCGTDNRPYFRPNANATRGQLAKIVASAAQITGTPTGQRYADVAPDSTFYVWIEQLSALGVMGGYACGRPSEPCDEQNRPYFRPNNNVTRGQASKIVANTFFPGCETP
jgi:VCBS repeat protein/S-layer family protein